MKPSEVYVHTTYALGDMGVEDVEGAAESDRYWVRREGMGMSFSIDSLLSLQAIILVISERRGAA